MFYKQLLLQQLICSWGSLHGIVVKVLDCNSVVSKLEFKLKLAQMVRSVDYINCISAKVSDPTPNECSVYNIKQADGEASFLQLGLPVYFFMVEKRINARKLKSLCFIRLFQDINLFSIFLIEKKYKLYKCC